MTKKDYQILAEIFADSRPFVGKRSTALQRALRTQWGMLRAGTMGVLKKDNPDFDCHLFIQATEQ